MIILTVTKIQQQKNDDKRYSIFIDGEFVFGITGVQVLYFKLEEGKEISQSTFDEISNEIVLESAKKKALRYLSYRARSRKEVYDKLAYDNKDFSGKTIMTVMDFLEEYGYIDDDNFAESYIKDKINLNKFGLNRIKAELKQKGVEEKTIADVITKLSDSDFPFNQKENALDLLDKRYKNSYISDLKEKKKAYNFLMRKGYDIDIIRDTVEVYEKDMGI